MISSRLEQAVAAFAGGSESRFGTLRLGLAVVTLVMCFGTGQVADAFLQVPDEPSPESGTAQVVAQGVIDIGEGERRWRVAESTAAPPANASPTESATGFLIVDSGVLLAEDVNTGEQQRLPAGEAMLTVAGAEQIRAALGSESAVYRELTLVDTTEADTAAGSVLFTGEPFAGPGARHDVDLLQNALAAGGTMTIPAGALPTLVLVLDGVVEITTETGDVFALGAGEAIDLSGELVVTATESGANVSIAYIGPSVPSLAGQQDASDLAAEEGTPVPGLRVIASPGAEPREATRLPATPVPAVEPTVEDTDATDDDADGLTAQEEAEAGTDANLSDTDQDGLSDGEEVLEVGTAPLNADTDGDGVLDGDEVARGTDPLTGPAEATTDEAPTAVEPVVPDAPAEADVPATAGDSDGDGLEDAIEAELGTDPFDLDTDDDGLTDGDEYYVYVTGTRNPDSDGDGVLDGAEVANGTDPNDPSSF